jgi:hypothetical protein
MTLRFCGMREFIIGAVFISLVAIVMYFMIRVAVGMQRGDYKGTGASGIIGAMAEIDRIVRPSVENVVDAKESADKKRDDVGGE